MSAPADPRVEQITERATALLRAATALVSSLSLRDLRVLETRERIDRKFNRLRLATIDALLALTPEARLRLARATATRHEFAGRSGDSPHAAVVDAIAALVLPSDMRSKPSNAARNDVTPSVGQLRELGAALGEERMERHARAIARCAAKITKLPAADERERPELGAG